MCAGPASEAVITPVRSIGLLPVNLGCPLHDENAHGICSPGKNSRGSGIGCNETMYNVNVILRCPV